MLVDRVCDIMLNHMVCATMKQRNSRRKSIQKERSELGSENKRAMIHVHTRVEREERDIPKKILYNACHIIQRWSVPAALGYRGLP